MEMRSVRINMRSVRIDISCMISFIWAYPEGPPLKACTHMFPTDHGASAQTADPYFKITTSTETYSEGGTIEVTLEATSNYYEGVFIQARRTNCDNTEPVGTFTLSQGETFLKTMNCNNKDNSAVAHQTKRHETSKTITWKAPAETVGQIYFQGTFVRNEKTFWVGVFSPIIKPVADSAKANEEFCPVESSVGNLSISLISLCLSMIVFKLL
ncbi:hypothetical protein LOTGIDRAFT_235283 [Lottia gigantea]|uniref:Reelin domain-containing protein n=1 Tax=Lottia gigantea TaxID=225164 RepID=V3ZVP3_LOTGI|nr:hypothetical protein LOTGIDRAFT_235283 [Lottia gigantea]ESO86675.1 hypothetical protein LOTGIDRAFT_235283 [Lottia gigantea]